MDLQDDLEEEDSAISMLTLKLEKSFFSIKINSTDGLFKKKKDRAFKKYHRSQLE